MEIKPYWVFVAGFVLLFIFVLAVMRYPKGHGGRWPVPRSQPWVGPGGTHHPQPWLGPGGTEHPHPWIGPGGTQHTLGPGGTQHMLGPGGTQHLYEGFADQKVDAIFTMFGTGWCEFCKNAKPEFQSLGETITTNGGKVVKIRYVDVEKEPAAAKGYDIGGYPTFYLETTTKKKYDGKREKSGFLEFLNKELA